LTGLTSKEKLDREPKLEKASQNLKIASTTVLILIHPHFSKPFYMETNAPNFSLKTILLQKGDDKKLNPVAFYSRKN